MITSVVLRKDVGRSSFFSHLDKRKIVRRFCFPSQNQNHARIFGSPTLIYLDKTIFPIQPIVDRGIAFLPSIITQSNNRTVTIQNASFSTSCWHNLRRSSGLDGLKFFSTSSLASTNESEKEESYSTDPLEQETLLFLAEPVPIEEATVHKAKELISEWTARFSSPSKNMIYDFPFIIARSQSILDHVVTSDYVDAEKDKGRELTPLMSHSLSTLQNKIIKMHVDMKDIESTIDCLHNSSLSSSEIFNFYPNVTSYHTVLKACASRKLSQEAEDLLLKMLKRAADDKNADVSPSTTTLNIVLSAQRQPDRALHILKRMITLWKIDGHDNVKPDIISFNTVSDLYASQPRGQNSKDTMKRSDKVLSVWEVMETEMNGDDILTPNEKTYNILMKSHIMDGNITAAETLLFDMANDPKKPSPDTFSYTTLMDGYVKGGDVKRAEDMLLRMRNSKDRNVPRPTTATFNSLMSGLCKAGHIKRAENLLTLMGKGRFSSPDEGTYSILIDAYCMANKPTDAHRLLNQIDNSRSTVEPQNFHYNSVISAYAAAGKAELAHSILRHMEVEVEKGNRRVLPDTITYNIVLSAYLKKGVRTKTFAATKVARDVESLIFHMERLRDQGYDTAAPDIISYSTLMSCWGKANPRDKPLDKMRELLDKVERLEDESILDVVDATPYNTYLVACADHPLRSREEREEMTREAWRVMKRMQSRSSRATPNILTYNSVLLLLVKQGFPEKAHELLQKMEEEKNNETALRPTLLSYNTVLHGYAREGDPVNAMILLTEMKENCTEDKNGTPAPQPNINSYNNVMAAFAKNRDADRATKLLQSLIDSSSSSTLVNGGNDVSTLHDTSNKLPRPDKHTYTTCMNAWMKSGSPDSLTKSLEIMNKMIADENVIPDTAAFNSLITAVGRSQEQCKVKMTFEILDQMVGTARPDVTTLNAVLNVCNFSKSTEDLEGSFRIAQRLIKNILGENDENQDGSDEDERLRRLCGLRPDDVTFGNIVKSYAFLPSNAVYEEKLKEIKQIMVKASDGGQISDYVLESLRYSVKKEDLRLVLRIPPDVTRRSDGRISIEDLPRQWSRNVRKRKFRNRVY